MQRLHAAEEALLTRMTTPTGLATKAQCVLEFIEERDTDFAGELARSLAEDVVALFAVKANQVDTATLDERQSSQRP